MIFSHGWKSVGLGLHWTIFFVFDTVTNFPDALKGPAVCMYIGFAFFTNPTGISVVLLISVYVLAVVLTIPLSLFDGGVPGVVWANVIGAANVFGPLIGSRVSKKNLQHRNDLSTLRLITSIRPRFLGMDFNRFALRFRIFRFSSPFEGRCSMSVPSKSLKTKKTFPSFITASNFTSV